MSETAIDQQPYIGSYVLESLTTGMYGESENAIREYVQNAFDALRSAVQQKLITDEIARITVTLTAGDQITIYDNGVGVAASAAYTTLTSIGASKKDRQKQAGFRGIGRLAGIAFCDRLTFRTKAQGDDFESTVAYNCVALRNGMNNGTLKLVDLLQSAVSFEQLPSTDKSAHFMEVNLIGLSAAPEVFKDAGRLRTYLAETSPVGFEPSWDKGPAISEYASKTAWAIETARLSLGTSALALKPIYKLYKDAFVGKGDSLQKIEWIEYFLGSSGRWWAWVGHTNQSEIVNEKNVHGLRVRVKNIAIDKTTILDELFTMVNKSYSRFNSYYVGEVHISPSLLIPNARRDGFEDNEAWRQVKKELERELCKPLGKKAYENSKKRQRSLEKIEKDLTKFTAEANKAIRANDVSAKHIVLTKLANLRSKMADVTSDATPETQTKLKTQLQQLNAVQRSIDETLESGDCKAAVQNALEKVFSVLETHLGPSEYRSVKKAIEGALA
jgi:molecular chaperone HtpG